MQATATIQPLETERTANWWVVPEVLAFAALAFGSRLVFAQFAWAYSGPMSLLLTLVVLTLYLRARGVAWRDMGLIRLPGWRAKALVLPKALVPFALFAAAVALVMFVGEPMGLTRTDTAGVEERWGNVEGNLPMLLLWLGLVWTSAAFGEEMFFRGYMVTRLAAGLAGVPGRLAIAVLLPALIFGYGHYYYQGLFGLVMTGLIGLAFAISFLLLKRNLWPLVLVHGTIDTINFVALYLGEA
ncbi:CPBP family intramembrane metalloprotease [Qipengyuania sp. YG27]|uniref:CPBP family intramembrane metalloprotease n=1 Tax=Qipengyuania mesophila TaxID=2867246 RepID=A0ABS7JW49_9SPHN|nr:CPBP family intramembrane glutamic endopeptidase [Qipengyuania mesophila]MBX7501887.1 CPBP family intramembrane metalloprotease [Qipengyuania mesophila]